MMTEAYEHTTDFEEDCKSGPIVPVNCDSCQVRKDHEAELSRYRAFVDELKMVADRASLWVTPEVITELINKHGLGEQE